MKQRTNPLTVLLLIAVLVIGGVALFALGGQSADIRSQGRDLVEQVQP